MATKVVASNTTLNGHCNGNGNGHHHPSEEGVQVKVNAQVATRLSPKVPALAAESVMCESGTMPEGTPIIQGFNWDKLSKGGDVNYSALLDSFLTSGFQATNFGLAVERLNHMLSWRLSHEPIPADATEEERDPAYRESVKCKVFLGYTSNMISSGVRETLLYLVKNKLVDVLVTTAGGIEEDFIKTMAPTFMGSFELDGATLRAKGLNRIGNMVIPNDNYCKFQDWIFPILDAMHKEQMEQGVNWTPSKLINRLGKEINNENSVYYWCWKNNIPVFSPAVTDGSIGDMLYFHSYDKEGLRLDLVEDIRAMNNHAIYAKRSGVVILGGGLIKHHILNANMMRNGADYAVFVNTAQEFDGSDAGARPDEAISWGKIKSCAKAVKIYAEATLVFPLLVAKTFAQHVESRR